MVLDECGVNSGSLYHFFPSKEALAVAVIEGCADRLSRGVLDAVEESTEAPLDRMTALLDLVRSGVQSEGGGDGTLVWLLAAELGDRRPEILAAAERYQRAMTHRVQGWLDQAGPRLPSFANRSGLAEFVTTVIEGGTARARAVGTVEIFDSAVSQLEQYLVVLEDVARRERLGEVLPVREEVEERRRSETSVEWRSW